MRAVCRIRQDDFLRIALAFAARRRATRLVCRIQMTDSFSTALALAVTKTSSRRLSRANRRDTHEARQFSGFSVQRLCRSGLSSAVLPYACFLCRSDRSHSLRSAAVSGKEDVSLTDRLISAISVDDCAVRSTSRSGFFRS